MEILYLLIPITVLLAFLVLGIFAWALKGGQFESIEREGERILEEDAEVDSQTPVDGDQGTP